MTNSGLASPPRAAPQRPPHSAPEGSVERIIGPRRRDAFGRILGWSLFLSAAAHVLVLLLSPLFIQTDRPPGSLVPVMGEAEQQLGMQIVEVIASENAPDPTPVDEQETTPALPVPPPPTQAPAPADGAGQSPPAAGGEQPAGPSTRDALQPGYRDPRLYVAPRPLPELGQQTDHERYMEHLQARIDAVNDSMAVEARRNSTTADWTVTDGSGNRWGLSSDGLHLGGVTIPRELLPLPGATGDNQRLQEERDRQRQRDEIQRQEEARERAAARGE
jgi:hypothetical protein